MEKMSGSTTGSSITLIPLVDEEPKLKKPRPDNKPRETPKKHKKSAIFSKSFFRRKKECRVDHDSGIAQTNNWVNGEKIRRNGTATIPTNSKLFQAESPSLQRHQTQPSLDNKANNSILSSFKSLCGKKQKEVNVNRSDRSKLFYFGFLLPALALHPEALKECDTPKYDDDFKLRLAAAHINDAINSRGKFGEARALLKSEFVQNCYSIISSRIWEYIMYVFIALHCLMAFWEQSPVPTSVGSQWEGNWQMNVAVLIIDAICTLGYITDIILWIFFLSWRHFWVAKENFWIRMEFVFTAMFLVDYVIIVLQRTLDKRLIAPFRCLRAAMLLCKSKNVSHIFKVLISIMSRLGKVFSIILIFIFTFASIGLHLFMEDYHVVSQTCSNSTETNCTSVYSGAFDNVAIAGLHMFVLMSTENYPDVIIPAYTVNNFTFFYFVLYLYAGVFFLTAILLAIIVESYWEYSKKHVKMERLRQREELIQAWNLLDLNGTGFLSVDNPKLVKLFSILKPENTEDENLELIHYMSENNTEYIIDSFDWTTRLVQTLSIEFDPEIIDKINLDGSSTRVKIRKFCAKIIHGQGIGMTILILILLHSILFCLMWSGITATAQLALQATRTVIVSIFVFEVIFRIIADGKKLLNILDILDIIMVVVAFAANITWYCFLIYVNSSDLYRYYGPCIVASSLAVLARLLFNSEQARSAVHILRNIYPVMFDLILLVIIIIYFYAILGLEIFQDNTLTKSQSQGFEGSYLQYGCGVGFETFGCALLIVFQIVTTNDWHQIMLGAMIDAGWGSAFYFVSCFLIIDMIVMNLFVAISIEAYKKLARDDREVAAMPEVVEETEELFENSSDLEANPENNTSSTGNRPTKTKADRSLGEAAKDAFTGIFASTRTTKHSNTQPAVLATPSAMQVGRRGTRGSVGVTSIHMDSSDDDAGNDTVFSRASIPLSPRSRNRTFRLGSDSMPSRKRSTNAMPDPSSLDRKSSIKDRNAAIERRQKLMKARSERVRKERKGRQKQLQETEQNSASNTLSVPYPKMSMSDVVKLKRMVKIISPYDAKTSEEMNVKQGQMFVISEENEDMYHGPDGWFPKGIAVDISLDAGNGPFEKEDKNNDRKRKVAKVVNFNVETEVVQLSTPPTLPRKASFAQSPNTAQQRPSIQRMRIRKDGNDWRRDILGDMTVMNKKEAEELQKKLKGGNMNFQRHQSRQVLRSDPSRLSLLNNRIKPANGGILQESIEEREENSTPPVPVFHISEPQSASEASAESNENTNTSKQNADTLTVPKSSAKKTNKSKGNGEMPDWMKNFAASTGVVFQQDLKFDENSIKSSGTSDDEEKVNSVPHNGSVEKVSNEKETAKTLNLTAGSHPENNELSKDVITTADAPLGSNSVS